MSQTAQRQERDAPVLRTGTENGIRTLTLNRPKQRNSLSDALIEALQGAIEEAGRDADARVVVIDAEGPVFCAGHDLKEMTAHRNDPDRGRAYYEDLIERCSAMMQAIVQCPKPVIAKVHGVATAAGCQLVATCDLVIASEEARFATPGVNIGLFCSTPMVALSRAVHPRHAMEMLLTGEMIPAERAREIGLVNRVVAAGDLDRDAAALAGAIAAKSSLVLKIGKEAFYQQSGMGLADAYAYTSGVMVENMMARDAEEGIGAFVEKREPRWEDR